MFHKVTLSIAESAELYLLPLIFWNFDWFCLLFSYQDISVLFWRTENSFHLGQSDVFLNTFLDYVTVLAKEYFFELFELIDLSFCTRGILRRVAQPHTWIGRFGLHIITGKSKHANRAHLRPTRCLLDRSLNIPWLVSVVSHERSSLVNLNLVHHFESLLLV